VSLEDPRLAMYRISTNSNDIDIATFVRLHRTAA